MNTIASTLADPPEEGGYPLSVFELAWDLDFRAPLEEEEGLDDDDSDKGSPPPDPDECEIL